MLLTGPAVLLGAGRIAADREGVSFTEWVRRAIRVRLGWHEVAPEAGHSPWAENRARCAYCAALVPGHEADCPLMGAR